MYEPCGFRILIEMDTVEQEVTEGALTGFQLQSDNEQKREEDGHCIGRVAKIGPTAFMGYAGCDAGRNGTDAAEIWGVKVGDMVEFQRYDGKIPLLDKDKQYRIINDSDIIMVVNNA